MINFTLHGSFVYILFKTPRIIAIVYKCKMVLCKIIFVLNILLFIIQSIFFKNTLKIFDSNQSYKDKFDLHTFTETTYAILGTEILTACIQTIFLYHYGYIYRK